MQQWLKAKQLVEVKSMVDQAKVKAKCQSEAQCQWPIDWEKAIFVIEDKGRKHEVSKRNLILTSKPLPKPKSQWTTHGGIQWMKSQENIHSGKELHNLSMTKIVAMYS